ncbi:PREDICTED: coatomer subunit gamma-2-like [Amphimedon queenslandica]|uniref:Coatomer subunit gamma n=1 Tax=Amphimedon queenslandica TaxID=400682 RepID=A0A1X7VAU0_AMPQE|nr:PREDICTED: coatomer subunit gamma-2-like [Amphimedon queenslandica]|eukprot:XP_003384949.1 PREDICTED: coatomer subunit gamma-2-like [Amphimedon queenslandica]
MNVIRGYKKDDEEGGKSGPFQNLEKSTVLQEARAFNDNVLNNKKCTLILTKILYLMNQGVTLTPAEATQTFFAITKLWQSKDITLRRLVYVSVKEMAKIANDVIIVTSSLTKDMTGKEDQYRGSAIRALCVITDNTMVQAIERYMKQAIVDRNPSVSSAALVSALHIFQRGAVEIVKRWVNEAQEASTSDHLMVQYHAIGLLYHIRKHDRLAVTKMVTKLSRSGLRSPFGYCLLIRIACKVLEREERSSNNMLYDFLESCLRHKNDMVVYEAARAMVNLSNITARELQPAVSVLQMFLSSPKAVTRFAAVKTLNRIAMIHPDVVTSCNIDLENLISDTNRSIATLAITTLLKTGNEASVDRLMKQITSFMSEISDEFKTVVVEAIRSVCIKFPRKHHILMTFLANMLREEGGFDYKKAIVNTIIAIIEENSEIKDVGLSHLCEFIEDCEHIELATRILHLLGREGPRTQKPYKYIRFIYNRVLLEAATVRAAAVTSLAKFGASCEDLLESILVLLERCLLDNDDEVRDRALLYMEVLKQKQKSLSSAFILNPISVSVVGLERALLAYCSQPNDDPFDIKTVPIETTPYNETPKSIGEVTTGGSVIKSAPVASKHDIFVEQLSAIPQFSKLGPLFKSSDSPVELTESETEYVVRCVKHTYLNHLVFQFDVTNTLNDQLLENVRVEMEETEGFSIISYIPIASLPYGQPKTAYTLVGIEDNTIVSGTFLNTLKFIVKDCDPNTGEPDDDQGYDDEYVLENVDILLSDHMQRIVKPNFAASWEEIGEENQTEGTYALSSMKDISDAVKQITGFLGMQSCERSDQVDHNRTSHTLLLAGVFRGGHEVLVRARLAQTGQVTMKMTVRSKDLNTCELVAAAIN